MNHKRWIKKVFIVSAIIVFVTGSINYVIDPHSMNMEYKYEKLNLIKIRLDERIDKFNYLKQNKDYEAIILGASNNTVLDPSIVEIFTGYNTYNASFSSGTIDEYLLYIKWLVKHRKVKLIILGIDFFAFSSEFKSGGTIPLELQNNYYSKLENIQFLQYFKMSLLYDSFKTIKYNMNNKISLQQKEYLNKGMRYYSEYFNRLKSNNLLSEHVKKIKKSNIVLHGKTINYDRLNDLKMIVDLCNKNNIKLILHTNPTTYLQLKYNNYFGYNKELELINEIVLNISPIYDFNNLGYLNYNLKYFEDYSHFNYDIGSVILNNMLSDKTKYYVNKENLSSWINKKKQKIKDIND
jgi:hypothetical protein